MLASPTRTLTARAPGGGVASPQINAAGPVTPSSDARRPRAAPKLSPSEVASISKAARGAALRAGDRTTASGCAGGSSFRTLAHPTPQEMARTPNKYRLRPTGHPSTARSGRTTREPMQSFPPPPETEPALDFPAQTESFSGPCKAIPLAAVTAVLPLVLLLEAPPVATGPRPVARQGSAHRLNPRPASARRVAASVARPVVAMVRRAETRARRRGWWPDRPSV